MDGGTDAQTQGDITVDANLVLTRCPRDAGEVLLGAPRGPKTGCREMVTKVILLSSFYVLLEPFVLLLIRESWARSLAGIQAVFTRPHKYSKSPLIPI